MIRDVMEDGEGDLIFVSDDRAWVSEDCGDDIFGSPCLKMVKVRDPMWLPEEFVIPGEFMS